MLYVSARSCYLSQWLIGTEDILAVTTDVGNVCTFLFWIIHNMMNLPNQRTHTYSESWTSSRASISCWSSVCRVRWWWVEIVSPHRWHHVSSKYTFVCLGEGGLYSAHRLKNKFETIMTIVEEDSMTKITLLKKCGVKFWKYPIGLFYKSQMLIFWNETCCDCFIYSNTEM